MGFCNGCGSTINEEEKVCPVCGAENTNGASTQDNVINEFTNTQDNTADFASDDIEANKVLAVLSYLGILSLIPLLAAKNSEFAQYHAKQGVNLFIIEIIYSFAISIISGILLFVPVIGALVSGLLSLLSIVFFILAVMGIVNVLNGKAKELPIVGKIKIVK